MSPLSTLALVGGLATVVLLTGCSQDVPTEPADSARGGTEATLAASPGSPAPSLPAGGAGDIRMLKLGRPESETWNSTGSSTRDLPPGWR